MKTRNQSAIFNAQHDLDEGGYARRRIAVADVGLDRPESAARRRIRAGKYLAQRFDFNGVAQRRGGSLSFNAGDLFRLYTRGLQRPLNYRPLAFHTPRRVTDLCMALLIKCPSPDDRLDIVTLAHG